MKKMVYGGFMQRKIVAIGGGDDGRLRPDGTLQPYELAPQDTEIIRLTGKAHPNFLLIAHSQPLSRQDYYFEVMVNIYEKMYGCACRHLKSDELYDKEKVKEIIDWADIIYEGGGNTLDMIKLWRESGFDIVLKKAWEDGKVMCGVSAGANCWFKECSTDSLKIKYGPDQPFASMECLGFIDGLFVPHCDEPGRLESLKEMLKKSDQVGISISNCAALEIIDDQYRLITGDASNHNIVAYGLKTYWCGEEYVEIFLDRSESFKPLAELLLKK